MIGLWTEGLNDLPKTISLVSASLTTTLMLPICTTTSALIFSESIVDYTSSFFSLTWYTCLSE
jgi:ABC-type dipeptide/oligopeptide/nickel transport system permease component